MAECPSSDLLREQAYLVAHGVRALALVGTCDATEAQRVESRLAVMCVAGAIPFVVPTERDQVTFGFARRSWVVDLFRWATTEAPQRERDRIIGLLLGYDPCAIADFDEWGLHLPSAKESANGTV